MNKKNIYVAIQIIMISIVLGTSVEIMKEFASDDIVNVDQIILYIFLIIGCLFVGVVFNGKASKIAEGLGGPKNDSM